MLAAAPRAWRAGLQCENGLSVFSTVEPTLHPRDGCLAGGDAGAPLVTAEL